MAKADKKIIDKVFVLLGVVVAVVLLAVGGLAWTAHTFATSMVHDELASQKIFFPAKDSAAIKALPVADQEQMNKYAGQQLVTGDQAKVYANHFIAVHLGKIAGGKTYSEVSAQSMANPGDAALKAKVQTLFQGETLRGLLLGDGYAYWTIGQIAGYAAVAAFAGAVVIAGLALLGMRHIAKLR